MEVILDNAMTIMEKSQSYTAQKEIDYTFLDEWRSVRTLLSDKYFDLMLKEMGLSKKEFAYSLQPIKCTNTHDMEWFNEFTKIINSFSEKEIDFNIGVSLPTLPFNRYLYQELKKVISKLDNLQVSNKVIDAFLEAHHIEMFNIIGKIIALKLEEYKHTHKFCSKDSEERFQEFLKATLNSKESFVNLFKEYPVAARIATVRTIYFKNNFCRILKNVDADYSEIKEFLKMDCLNLTDITLATGDSHEQGKAVSILHFEEKKLVYKPKNLEISKAFEAFVTWYTEASSLMPIRIPKGIYKKDYTYNEFIAPKYCESEEEVERFYVRYGYLIVICYLLNLNDLHLENVIAHGEHPVIIDIETAFQTPPKMEMQNLYIDLFKQLTIDSVSNSLLLPRQVIVGVNDEIDLSALSGKEVKLTQKFLAPTKVNTDKFHYEKVPGYFSGGDNIPKRNESEEVDIKKYSLKIIEGFDEFITFVLKNKDECLNILNAFRGKKVRTLIKGTEKYASMLRYADHPNYNREMKYRERLMMNIWAYPYQDKRIIKSEVRDLIFNDIPIFYSYTDSRDLLDSQGEIYKEYHSLSGFELAINKISSLTKKEIDLQRAIMFSHLGIYDLLLNEKALKKPISFTFQKMDYLKQAKKIATMLIQESIVKREQCSFINVDCDKNKHWELAPCDESLYGGLSGIALFFLELYRETGDNEYYECYKKLINTAIEQTRGTGFKSAFTEWLSPIYPLLLEHKYFNTVSNKKFLEFTIEKLESMKSEDVKKIKNLDYISGLSGILRLLQAIRVTFKNNYISDELLQKFFDEVISRIDSGEEKAMNNVGIAHGISGIMLGISSTGMVDSNFIKKYLSQEYMMKMPQKNVYKWCWGLPGMIQARIELLKTDPKSVDENQLQKLIMKFEKSLSSMISEDCMCHGNGSIIITLKMLFDYTKETKWHNLLHIWMTNISINSLLKGYQIPSISDFSTKGVFDGLSGIGWMYLFVNSAIDNLLLLEIK